MPHFHIPLQSGSDAVLEKMRRRYKTDLYRQRVSKIKELMPHAGIGVDVITGFPGETEEEFLKTYEFLNELDVSYLHVFTFSERENTDAIDMVDGVVPIKERQRRSKMLRNLSEKKKRAFYEQHIGYIGEVLYEADIENGMMSGFTDNYIRFETEFDPLLINEMQKVKITSISDNQLATGYGIISENIII